MADLLLELFSEEIPARMQEKAVSDLALLLQGKIISAGLLSESECQKSDRIDYFVTPRRLAVWVKNLPEKQPDISTELKGPKIDAPQAAIDGFLKKNNLTLAQCEKRDGVYFATIEQKGKATGDILKPLIEDILKHFPWPKSMRWDSGEQSWVRPLHSMICLFGGKVVPVEFAGVKATNSTKGHRFLAPGPITINRADEYEAALENAFVIADRDKRKMNILLQAQETANALGVALKQDEGLLDEVTGLVEWPVVLAGKIDSSYMDLPKEVLISEMRAHQKYFACETKDGALSDVFLITANMKTADAGKAIIAGNERVLRARLADGRFFWDQDRKKKLEDWAQGLASVMYHAKLGSVADKVARIKRLSLVILSEAKNLKKDPSPAAQDDIARAATLCKADLVTGMVGEFPELQGVMGRYYALHQKERPEIADAIRNHYLPLGPSSPVPTAPVSICVALADKLDTLASMFAIGEKPTGSKDPFALRRAALGVIRIVLENNLRLSLTPLLACAPFKEIAVHKAHEKLVNKTEVALSKPESELRKVGKYLTVNESASEEIPEGASAELAQSLLAFFHDRLIVQMKDSGIRHDVIKAVVAGGDDDLVRIVSKAKAVQAFLETEDGKNLLAGYKRAANILAIEEKKDKTTYQGDVDFGLLKQLEEGALANGLSMVAPSIAHKLRAEQFAEAMKELSRLREPVDRFFDKIMVNDQDATVRANRLCLLAGIRDAVNSVADFGKIEG